MFEKYERQELHRALAGLSPDYCTVLHLIYFENMSYAEAGAVMKKSRKQIENLAMRARCTLRTAMEKEGSAG